VVVTPEEHQWQAFMTMMGNPEWSREEWCRDPRSRFEHVAKINKHILAWMKEHTKEEIFRKGQGLSCPIAPLKSAQDVMESEQLNGRDFFVETSHPEMGTVKIPATPYHFSKTPSSYDCSAPLLGQHNQEIFGERLGYSQNELDELAQQDVI
jgi:crotonobetainyl-CoA:carnitine CoA-transferase CaiB-like acyl-CoA transferase